MFDRDVQQIVSEHKFSKLTLELFNKTKLIHYLQSCRNNKKILRKFLRNVKYQIDFRKFDKNRIQNVILWWNDIQVHFARKTLKTSNFSETFLRNIH